MVSSRCADDRLLTWDEVKRKNVDDFYDFTRKAMDPIHRKMLCVPYFCSIFGFLLHSRSIPVVIPAYMWKSGISRRTARVSHSEIFVNWD